MPQYYDKKTKTWYCSFRYRDFTGKYHQTKKRGFALKREAKEYEERITNQYQGKSNITVGTLADLFLADYKLRHKPNSYKQKASDIKHHIKPYFSNQLIDTMTVKQIRDWGNHLISKTKLKASTVRAILCTLKLIIEYGRSTQGIKRNVVIEAGHLSVAPTPITEKNVWEEYQFKHFIECEHIEHSKIFFSVLFYTGMRFGEALALNANDFNGTTISITKNYTHIQGKTYIDSPKTRCGIRTVSIPPFLAEQLTKYIQLSGIKPTERLFPHTKSCYQDRFRRILPLTGLPKIRIHDLRHSHSSHLIHLGVPIPSIAKRLGHRSPDITLRVYSHFYKNDDQSIASLLECSHSVPTDDKKS